MLRHILHNEHIRAFAPALKGAEEMYRTSAPFAVQVRVQSLESAKWVSCWRWEVQAHGVDPRAPEQDRDEDVSDALPQGPYRRVIEVNLVGVE